MFVWARDMIDTLPEVLAVLRARFPVVFIDEAQDNSEQQSAILYTLFRDGGDPVIRQRFGDSNQAIFDSLGAREAKTDKFPDDSIKMVLPNSYRFGQSIADLVNPLGLIPQGLKGQEPLKKCLASGAEEGRHTVFLFDDCTSGRVLNAYGELLLETFSECELQDGVFTAVGHIHRTPEDEAREKFPQCVGHYWPDYDPELTSRDPKPRTFTQYVFAGMGRAEIAGEAHLCVEKIAEGILRLAGMIAGRRALAQRRNCHRYRDKTSEGGYRS